MNTAGPPGECWDALQQDRVGVVRQPFLGSLLPEAGEPILTLAALASFPVRAQGLEGLWWIFKSKA